MSNLKVFKLIPGSFLLVGLGLFSNHASAVDLVVDGSLCVGIDCPATPAFGFDTTRLQENNLRIHFDDTSSSASFPANDWRFIFNDSANGGGNYFAIEDATAALQVFRVDAGAPANSLRVDSGGDVGIGTSNPVVDLHMTSGNTPTVRLEQDGSSGFTPQTWDMASNETNFFIRDVTNGSKLPFRIRPDAPTSSIDIASNGNVGMGTGSPTSALHIKKDSAKLSVEDTTAGKATRSLFTLSNNGPNGFSIEDRDRSETWEFRSDNAGSFNINRKTVPGAEFLIKENGQVRMGPGSAVNFDLLANGNLLIPNGSVTANGILLTSSKHTKTDISAIKPAEVMEKLKKVKVAEWRYKKADKNDRHISPMAEDFYSLFKLGPSNKYINPNDLASVAIIAAKELQKENTALKQQLKKQGIKSATTDDTLQARLASLEKLVTNLASGQGLLPENGDQVVFNKVK